MSGDKSLPLREPSPEGERIDYHDFIEMHKKLAALELQQKKEKEKNMPPRTPPMLLSPIVFRERKKDFKERYNNIAKELQDERTTEAREKTNAALSNLIVGFQENSVELPYFQFRIDDEIIKGIPDADEDKGDDKIMPCLSNMPKEVVKGILLELLPQWQICFALTSKRVMKISKEINQSYGIVYGRAAKLHILWRLETWMTYSRKLCMACEKYYPVSTGYWKDRHAKGPCKTASKIYGRRYCDFEFVEGICPECSANKKWRSVCRASATHSLLER